MTPEEIEEQAREYSKEVNRSRLEENFAFIDFINAATWMQEKKDKEIANLKKCVTTQHDLFLEQCNEVEKRNILLDTKDKEIAELNELRENGLANIIELQLMYGDAKAEIAELKKILRK